MKTRMISAVMAAFMLAASVGGITASAEEGTAETTETTASEPADESSDDMEKFREDQGAGDVLERPIVPGPVPSAGPGSREPIRIPPSQKETELLPDKPLQIGVLTSNYHLYRAMQIGKKNGFASLSGVSASSDPVLFVHFCVRESLAILKDKFMGNM